MKIWNLHLIFFDTEIFFVLFSVLFLFYSMPEYGKKANYDVNRFKFGYACDFSLPGFRFSFLFLSSSRCCAILLKLLSIGFKLCFIRFLSLRLFLLLQRTRIPGFLPWSADICYILLTVLRAIVTIFCRCTCWE